MAQRDPPYEPSTRMERWAEDFLVRFIVGIGMGALIHVMTRLRPGGYAGLSERSIHNREYRQAA